MLLINFGMLKIKEKNYVERIEWFLLEVLQQDCFICIVKEWYIIMLPPAPCSLIIKMIIRTAGVNRSPTPRKASTN